MATEKPTEAEKRPFLTTLPGILTGIAAIITALAGLFAALGPTGLLSGRNREAPATASAPAAAPPAPAADLSTTGDNSPVFTGIGGSVSYTNKE
jgi:hypothetical protein